MKDGVQRLREGIDFGLDRAGAGQEKAVAHGTARVSKPERIMRMPSKHNWRTRQIRYLGGLAEVVHCPVRSQLL
jgi:hypothetical protein